MTRTINIPGESSFWGYEGEHNATVLVIALPDTFTGYLSISAAIHLKNDTTIIIDNVPVTDNAANITLTSQMTEFSGVLKLQLVAYGASSTIIAKSPVYVGFLAECVSGTPVPVAKDTLAAWFSNTLVEYEFPAGTRSVPADAFKNKTALKKLILPSSITSIGSNALTSNVSGFAIFYGGSVEDWGSLTLPASPAKWNTATKFNLYCNDEIVREARFSNGATTATTVYSYCTSITSVVFPDSITTTADYAFHNCSSLKNISLSSSLTKLSTYAFAGCPIVNIKIPGSVVYIGTYAFASAAATTIDCTELTVNGGSPKTTLANSNAFANSVRSFVFATEEIKNVYASATNWAALASKMTWVGA